MPTRLPKISFRWQIILLGTLVVVLFIAVLIGTLDALQYTKSAVLNTEKRRLLEAAQDLARNYMDEIKPTGDQPGSVDSESNQIASRKKIEDIAKNSLQKLGGIEGGFYRHDGELLLGYAPADIQDEEQWRLSTALRDEVQSSILETAKKASNTRITAEVNLSLGNEIFLIEAVPIGSGGSDVGSAWTMERMQGVPGSNRLRAYLVTVGLGVAALVCVILTLFVVGNLQAGVRKIESSLQNLESDLSSQIPTGADPEEIERIAQAINRLGASLKANIEREKQIEDRLRHSERLAALGRLVAGVAHEVRNPLATIRLRLQMAQREAKNPRVDESCAIALEEIERLNGMVNRLLNFSRPIRFQPESVNLKQLTEQRLNRFMESAENKGIRI